MKIPSDKYIDVFVSFSLRRRIWDNQRNVTGLKMISRDREMVAKKIIN